MLQKLSTFLMAWGPAGIFLLTLIDSAGVPLPVGGDALVIFLSARDPERYLLYGFLGVLGSCIGNLILFSIARKGGQALLDSRAQGERARRFREWFAQYGLLTVFVPALIPIPLPMKVFVLSAGALGTGWMPFLLTVLAARILRYGGEAYLGAQLGAGALDAIKAHGRELGVAAAVLFLALYALVSFRQRATSRMAR